MTSRERLVAAARGGDVDRPPVICWPHQPDTITDAIVVLPHEVQAALNANASDQAIVAEIAGVFSVATSREPNLNNLLGSDPHLGNHVLDTATQIVREQMADALESGADGIFYVLSGATPDLTSPMQYGGHYLERDREVLSDIQEARLNVIFIEGGEGTYLDFVSDLPAHVFGWNSESTGIPVEELRVMRTGALLAPSSSADVILSCRADLPLPLENQALAGV